MKVFVDNPFPVVLLKHQNSVRCLDLSARWVGRGGEGGVLGALIFILLLCLLNLGIYMYSTCMLRVQAFELTWELFFGMKGGWEGNMHHFCYFAADLWFVWWYSYSSVYGHVSLPHTHHSHLCTPPNHAAIITSCHQPHPQLPLLHRALFVPP